MSESMPVPSGDAVSASRETSPPPSLRRAIARVDAYTAHQGFWSAGVRLQRNLSLRMKVALAGFLVCVPLAGFVADSARTEWAAFERTSHRDAGLRQMLALSQLSRAITTVQREAVKIELGLPGATLETALKAEQERFDAFMQNVEQQEWPATTQAAMANLKTRHDAMVKLSTNGSADTLPGRGSARLESMADYALELTRARAEMARANALTADAPSGIRALDEVLARTLPVLRWEVARSVGVGAPLYASNDRQARARRLARLVSQAGVHLETLESHLVHATDHGRMEDGAARTALLLIKAHEDRSHKLAASAHLVSSEVELAVLAGMERAEYIRSGLQALEAIEALEDAAFTRFIGWADEQTATQRQHLYVFFAWMATWLALTCYLLFCSYRVMAGGLKTLVAHLEAIGRGDLSQTPQGLGTDEIGRALTALGASTGHMAQLFGAVTQGVAAVSQASREVAGGNSSLTSRSAEVRALIASVAQRADACSHSLDTCGEHVEKTAELVHDMRADGQRGRKAVGGLREGMARLQVKSREIGQVVSLVETVAYQTRLLSINASVEAARAGEAGKGFAVVAQEVRALAARSEAAAQRIAGIVNASIDEIEACGLMAERTDEAVQRNEDKIEAVDALMRETVELTRTGRTDSQAVLATALSVEETMTGNVRVVEQLASASASLRTQGDHLKRSLQHFVFG